MTKVTILGEKPQKKKLKKIEFVKTYRKNSELYSTQYPNQWDNIVLLNKNFEIGLDLMFAYDSDHKHCLVVLGHFNDGIV